MIRPEAAEALAVEGSAQSPVHVSIYEDLQCPDCSHFRTMLDQQLLPRYGAAVRFEHRDFPLAKHAWARQAAIAARFFDEAKPGLGIEYRKFALANIRSIHPGNFDERVSEFAREHGADAAQAVASLHDKRLAALVESDYQEGVAQGISKTPTVLVNGQPFIETVAFEDIAKAIDAQLAACK